MKKYLILHPLNGALNPECSTLTHSFEKVAEVEARDLSHAFYKAQNEDPGYAKLGIRSTSCGDIFVDEDTKDMYMVEASHFSVLCNHDHLLDDIMHGNSLEEEISYV